MEKGTRSVWESVSLLLFLTIKSTSNRYGQGTSRFVWYLFRIVYARV